MHTVKLINQILIFTAHNNVTESAGHSLSF